MGMVERVSMFVMVVLSCLVLGCENGKQVAGDGNAKGGGTNGSGAAPTVPLAPLNEAELELASEITKKKCNRCHKHDEKVGLMKSPGFLTTRKTLAPRLTPEAYGSRIKGLQRDGNKKGNRAYAQNKDIIEAIQAETDMNRRIEMWMTAYLKNPKFDHPSNKMLKTVVEDDESDILVRYIMNLE